MAPDLLSHPGGAEADTGSAGALTPPFSAYRLHVGSSAGPFITGSYRSRVCRCGRPRAGETDGDVMAFFLEDSVSRPPPSPPSSSRAPAGSLLRSQETQKDEHVKWKRLRKVIAEIMRHACESSQWAHLSN